MKNAITRVKWNDRFFNDYSVLEWQAVKVSMILLNCAVLLYILYTRFVPELPVGICTIIDCSLISLPLVKGILTLVILVLAALYLMEWKMRITPLLIFGVSVLIYTYEESHGLVGEYALLSLYFFAQWLAYMAAGQNLASNRIQFPAQFIAAAYILSGISKLTTSGAAWFTTDAPNFAVQVARRYYYTYADSGIAFDSSNMLVDFLLAHPLTLQALMAGAVLVELCAFILLINKKVAFVYALLLTIMHLFIVLLLQLLYPTIMFPMIIIYINPLYWVLRKWKHGYRRA